MFDEKDDYKNCRLEILPHVAKRAIERNYPIGKLRDMVFRGKWCAHVRDDRRTCIYKDGHVYWTIITVPWTCHVFILTIYQSTYSDIRLFKSHKSG